MNDILNKTMVLVLNRNWQAINIRTPREAFCQMAANVATALDIGFGDESGEASCHPLLVTRRASAIRSVTWDEWITLPIRDGDNAQTERAESPKENSPGQAMVAVRKHRAPPWVQQTKYNSPSPRRTRRGPG